MKFVKQIGILMIILHLGSFVEVNAQTLEFAPVVLDAGGQSSSTSWGEVSYSVGEAVVFTADGSSFNFWLTQGFEQPNTNTFSVLSAFVTATPPSCIHNTDGILVADASGGSAPYTYNWSTGKIGRLVDSLSAGTYIVTVTDSTGTTSSITYVLNDEQVTCGEVKIFKGFTPNNDGHNDNWHISGIEQFPGNEVIVFDRWGDVIWDGKNYDNINVVWAGLNKNGNPLPDATYFYVVKYGTNVEKGWVELTR